MSSGVNGGVSDYRSSLEAEGLPEVADDASPERERVEDPAVVAVPGDEPVAVDDFGTTAGEVRDGEPLDGRLAREQPDPALELGPPGPDLATDAYAPDSAVEGVGPLVAPDEGAHTDEEKDAIAREAGGDLAGLPAEEAAMRAEPE